MLFVVPEEFEILNSNMDTKLFVLPAEPLAVTN